MPIKSETGRKVFITNLGFHDYTAARKYGDIIPCTRGNVDLTQTDRIEAAVQAILNESEPEDYLLISGHPLVVALCIGYWFRLHRNVNILYYDPMIGGYIKRTTDFSNRSDAIDALLES